MSSANTVFQNGAQMITNYDVTKLFLGGNRYKQGSLKNTTGATVTILAGTLLGKVSAIAVDTANVVGYLRVYDSANIEGGAIPVGILANDLVILAGATAVNVNYCIAGDFDLGKLILANGTDTLATVVAGVAINEKIIAETQLIGVTVDQLTKFDNQ